MLSLSTGKKLFSLDLTAAVDPASVNDRHAPDENAANVTADKGCGFRHQLRAEPTQNDREENEHQAALGLAEQCMPGPGNKRNGEYENWVFMFYHVGEDYSGS